MLTEKEQKLVKKYCLYPTLGIAAFLIAIGSGGLVIVLEMIHGVFFSGSSRLTGLWVYVTIAAVYTVLCCYWLLSVSIGMKRKPWQEILRKTRHRCGGFSYPDQAARYAGLHAAGDLADRLGKEALGNVLDAAGSIQGAAAVTAMGREHRASARQVAQACYLEIPSAKGRVLTLILVPLVILTGCYIPQFRATAQNHAQSQQLAAQTIGALQVVFEENFADVFADDPMEEYRSDIGYDIDGYLLDIASEHNSRISVRVDNNGCIQSVTYSVDVDIHGAKTENLDWVDSQIQRMNGILNQAQVPALQPELTGLYPLPQQFRERFTVGSYYESIYGCSETVGSTEINYSFATEDEESYDEYSSSRIYVSAEAPWTSD